MGRQLISSEEAVRAKCQHARPCSDCPFARKALNGWLGGGTVESWVADAQSDARLECHVMVGAQCAGAAIFRANVCKAPRDPSCLRLPPDRKLVFANQAEFEAHHRARPRFARSPA